MGKANVVFILVDALRATSLGCYGYTRNTSPIIDSIAERGVLFEKAFCTVNATDPSLTTIFSGFYPRSHGIVHHGDQIPEQEIRLFEERNVRLLPEILRENGYSTFGLDWLGRWHRRGYDYYAGFNVDRVGRKKTIKRFAQFLERIGARAFFKKIYYLPFFRNIIGKFDLYSEDAKLTRQAVDIIRKQEAPFFMFIHYWGLHAPYNAPRRFIKELSRVASPLVVPPIDKTFSGIKNEKYRAFYEQWTKSEKSFGDIILRHDGAIRQIDTLIGEVVTALRENGILDNTLIVITSDHGESLVEHNILFDHHGLYDASIHVPVIMSLPKRLPQAKKVAALVQHPDIMPTVLALLDIASDGHFDGYGLLDVVSGRVGKVRDAAFTEENYYEEKECIRTMGHKMIRALREGGCSRCGIAHGGAIELYDLAADPGETHNIASREKEKVAQLLSQLDNYKKRFLSHSSEDRLLDKAIADIRL